MTEQTNNTPSTETTTQKAEKMFLYPYNEIKKLMGLLVASPWNIVHPIIMAFHDMKSADGNTTFKEEYDKEVAAVMERQKALNAAAENPTEANDNGSK